MDKFNYKGWELWDAMDALMAYDQGCTDSGVKDELMKEEVKKYLLSMNDKDFIRELSRYTREQMLTEERLEQGYGIEDVISFIKWLDEELDICL